jgi:hypothetical protein
MATATVAASGTLAGVTSALVIVQAILLTSCSVCHMGNCSSRTDPA